MKGKVLFFTLILFILSGVSIFADSTVYLSPSPNWLKRAVGCYECVIISANLPLPGKTQIFLDAKGNLQGDYMFLEDGTKISGILYNFGFFPPRGLNCTWKDSYGKGDLEITFNRYFSRFNGFKGKI